MGILNVLPTALELLLVVGMLLYYFERAARIQLQMQAAAARTSDPFDGLRLRGLAYAEFALANPEQYRLAMMRMPAVSACSNSAQPASLRRFVPRPRSRSPTPGSS